MPEPFTYELAAEIMTGIRLSPMDRPKQERLEPIEYDPPPNIPASMKLSERLDEIYKHRLDKQLCIEFGIDETQLDAYASGAEPIPLLELGRFHFAISEVSKRIPQAKRLFAKHDIPLVLFNRGRVQEDAPPLNSVVHKHDV